MEIKALNTNYFVNQTNNTNKSSDLKSTFASLVSEYADRMQYAENREPKFTIGGSEYSLKQWDKLISNFDKQED